jgi:hypothetical protein
MRTPLNERSRCKEQDEQRRNENVKGKKQRQRQWRRERRQRRYQTSQRMLPRGHEAATSGAAEGSLQVAAASRVSSAVEATEPVCGM